jgi:hypothetical protein
VWKSRNGYEKNVKVYIVKGGYRDVKRGLEERGWVENPDIYSPCFDFKWTCKVIDINYENLKENQIVNHFDNNQCCTSKFGLTQSLRTVNKYSKNNFFL